jgi:Bestrophin, RFP-TM, chloride channel
MPFFFTHPTDFDRVCLQDFQMLTATEMERMDQINLDAGGSAYRELIVWAMLEVQQAKDNNLIDKELAAMLRDQVLQLRAQAGQLYNAADLPIPFFYVHFICLLTALYLPLFAITQGINAGTGADSHWVVDVVAGLVVFLQSIFIIGLRIVGQKVSDPYGDDLVDFSVMFFIQFTWTQSNRILNSMDPLPPPQHQHHPEADNVEHMLARNRVTIGKAWDDRTDQGLGVSINDRKKKDKKQKNKRKQQPQQPQDHNDKVNVDKVVTTASNNVDSTQDFDDIEEENGNDDDDQASSTSSSDGSEMDNQIGFGNQQVK